MNMNSINTPASPKATLEQWMIFHAVVDHGSFQAAADKLLKSQSTVSYAMQKLQEGLGVKVFEHKGRRAVLTDAGQLILQRSKNLLDQSQALEKAAQDFAAGWEPQIGIVTNDLFPTDILHSALAQFGEECPQTRLEVFTEVLSGVNDLLIGGTAQLGLDNNIPTGMMGEPLLEMEFFRVAHPDHPLHHLGRPVTQDDMRQHRQIVIRDSGSRRRENRGWLGSEQRWTVSSMSESLGILRKGLGFGITAKHLAQEAIDNGELKPLNIEVEGKFKNMIYLIYANKSATGPAAQLLASIIKNVVKNARWS